MTKSPVFYASEQAAIDNMPQAVATRSRPVLASHGKQFIVCCKTTAKKHGWKVEGKLYFKTPKTAGEEAVVAAKAEAKARTPKQARRLLDLEDMLGTAAK